MNIKNIIFLASTILPLSTFALPTADFLPIESLVKQCELKEPIDPFEAGKCLGYIRGAQEVAFWNSIVKVKPPCFMDYKFTPKDLSYVMQSIDSAPMGKSDNVLDEFASMRILKLLHAKYPCKAP